MTQIATMQSTAGTLTQYAQSNPLTVVRSVTGELFEAIRAAAEATTQDALNTGLQAAWEHTEQLQALTHQQGEAFTAAYALSVSLAEQLTRLVGELVNNTPATDWSDATRLFAERIEDEVREVASMLALENVGNAMTSEFDISEEQAHSFVNLLMGGSDALTLVALDKMIPQLIARRDELIGAQA